MLVSDHLEEKQQRRPREPHGSRAQEVLQTSPDLRRGKSHRSGRSPSLESARQQVPQPISPLSSRLPSTFRRRMRRRRVAQLPSDLSVFLIPDIVPSWDGHVCTSVSLSSPFIRPWESFSSILIRSSSSSCILEESITLIPLPGSLFLTVLFISRLHPSVRHFPASQQQRAELMRRLRGCFWVSGADPRPADGLRPGPGSVSARLHHRANERVELPPPPPRL